MKQMSTVRIALSLLGLVQAAAMAADAPPTTQPDALRPVGQSQILRLWPGEPPATAPTDEGEKIVRRGGTTHPAIFVSNIHQSNLGVFLPQGDGPFPAVVICPGGAYMGESMTSEGHAVAAKLAKAGVAAFVLKYRLPDGQVPAEGKLPMPQQDVFRALQLVRSHAAEWKIDPKRVGVMGFSAGGHLAATAVTLFDLAGSIEPKDDVSQQPARPDFGVLVYPVISMSLPVTHAGSRTNLLGKDAEPATEARFDPAQHVTPQTPPLFIVHATDDKTVPLANAQLMLDAALKNKVSVSLVILSHGGHGFGLGNNPEAQGWSDQLLAWMRGQKLLN